MLPLCSSSRGPSCPASWRIKTKQTCSFFPLQEVRRALPPPFLEPPQLKAGCGEEKGLPPPLPAPSSWPPWPPVALPKPLRPGGSPCRRLPSFPGFGEQGRAVHVLLLSEVGRLSLRAGGLLRFRRAVGDHVADALAEVAFLGLRRELALFGVVVQPAAVVASARGGERFEGEKQKERGSLLPRGRWWPRVCFPGGFGAGPVVLLVPRRWQQTHVPKMTVWGQKRGHWGHTPLHHDRGYGSCVYKSCILGCRQPARCKPPAFRAAGASSHMAGGPNWEDRYRDQGHQHGDSPEGGLSEAVPL